MCILYMFIKTKGDADNVKGTDERWLIHEMIRASLRPPRIVSVPLLFILD